MEELIIIAAVVVAVGGGGTAAVLLRRRGPAHPGAPDAGTGTRVTGTGAGTSAAGTAVAEPEAGPAAPAPLTDAGLAAEAAAPPAIERPPPSAGRLVRLRSRLARSQSAFGGVLLGLLSRDRLDEATWEEIEDTLIMADMGVSPARDLVAELRTQVRVAGAANPQQIKSLLKAELLKQVGPDMDRSLHTRRHGDRPALVLVVGVNGTGKTTSVGKLARVLVGDGQTVLLGAADTFRAAAADQLQTWGQRVGAETVRSDRDGADPASVAFEAVAEGIERGVDTVIVDTAGRLHTKAGLMDELGKIKRVISRYGDVDEVLLVLDATTGQNGLRQARVFAEVVDVTGIILTKLDGTAKGGIVIAVQRELGVPVKLVGLGEGPDDLAPFEPAAFVDAIIGS